MTRFHLHIPEDMDFLTKPVSFVHYLLDYHRISAILQRCNTNQVRRTPPSPRCNYILNPEESTE